MGDMRSAYRSLVGKTLGKLSPQRPRWIFKIIKI
jgi:hypothetical protein